MKSIIFFILFLAVAINALRIRQDDNADDELKEFFEYLDSDTDASDAEGSRVQTGQAMDEINQYLCITQCLSSGSTDLTSCAQQCS